MIQYVLNSSSHIDFTTILHFMGLAYSSGVKLDSVKGERYNHL